MYSGSYNSTSRAGSNTGGFNAVNNVGTVDNTKTYRACAWWLGTWASRSFKLKQVVILARAGAISGFIPPWVGRRFRLGGRPRVASCGYSP